MLLLLLLRILQSLPAELWDDSLEPLLDTQQLVAFLQIHIRLHRVALILGQQEQ